MSFTQIYDKYQAPFLKYALRRVGNLEVARELVQEAFLKAHRFGGKIQMGRDLGPWLWAIARNTVSDWLRSSRADRQLELLEEEPESQEPNAEVLLVQLDERNEFARLFDKLTSLQRQVLQLRLIQQLSYEEIARTLGLSLSAVKCLVYRAKQVLSEAGKLVPATI